MILENRSTVSSSKEAGGASTYCVLPHNVLIISFIFKT